MKRDWEIFEKEVLSFLQDQLVSFPVKAEGFGGGNSNVPDIALRKVSDNSELFWIDAKLSIAQGYQFVVLYDKEHFIFSNENRTPNNQFSQAIINHMNENIIYYQKVNTAGIDLKCDSKLFYDWIVSHCIAKNVKYIITSNSLNSFKAIIPLDKIPDYFVVTAKYRVKRSGTSHLAKKHFATATVQLKEHAKTHLVQD